MSLEHFDDPDDIDDDELDRRRRKLEAKALRVADAMLDDSKTSATARASIIRGVLSDAAARRDDDSGFEKDASQMSFAELQRSLAKSERRLAHLLADDAEIEAVAPAEGDVFG